MIRETIKNAMADQGVTISSLAKFVGCRRATISDFLNGKTEMRANLLEKILNKLSIIFIPSNYDGRAKI